MLPIRIQTGCWILLAIAPWLAGCSLFRDDDCWCECYDPCACYRVPIEDSENPATVQATIPETSGVDR